MAKRRRFEIPGVTSATPMEAPVEIPAEAAVTIMVDVRRRASEAGEQPGADVESPGEVACEVDPLPPYVIPNAEEVS
jgi:hypothetical protein